MQITVNGQLLLSKLAEMVSLAIPEAQPLMFNTDGFEMMIPNDKVDFYKSICSVWEHMTQLSLEHDQYSKMIIRDVNNYMAITKDGKVKCKGAFEWEDLSKKKVATFHKNKSFLIIPKAIYAFFVHGTKPEDFLDQNQNIFDYCGAVKAKAGWSFVDRRLVDGNLVNTKLLGGVREFYSKHVSTSSTLFLNDDFWLSIYLNKIKNTKILSLESLIKERTCERLIYRQHIKQNALTDSYNPFLSRRTYAKFDYIKILFKERFFLNK
jgi:hypothetical protein